MSTRRLSLGLVLATMVACWPACASAPADVAFTPFELVSTDPALGLQAEYAYEPAISADGRFVVFTGIVASKHGIYRKDLANHELEVVALGSGAGSPSISADGQYVSFTSSDDPVTGQATSSGCTQVYRRDMEQKAAKPLEPGPESGYQIVSARSGFEEGLKYEGSSERNCPGGGAASANRVAISATGGEVAFTVIGKSNLIGEADKTETPENQVAVRDFETSPYTTRLVSVVNGSEKPVGEGATLSMQPSIGKLALSSGGFAELSHDDGSTAAISADGSVVAWMGVHIAEQATFLSSVPELQHPNPAYQYAEPLWRRIVPQPEATRRVLAGEEARCPPFCAGGLDLLWDEQRQQTGEEPVGPEFGSYVADWLQNSFGSDVGAVTPQLSANGEKVAILSTQPDYGHRPNFGTSATDKEKAPDANAFVVNMAPGLTPEQAITRLTEWGSVDFSETALDGSINQIAISGDGSRVSFETERNVFALAPPALITAPVSQVEPAQLYEDNLQAGTLALVSEGYNEEPANKEEGRGGVASAALSENGSVMALASGSSNLFFGALNEGSAVFVTRETQPPAEVGQQTVSPLPPGPSVEAGWSISATATPSSGGSLLIDVSVPGAGRLAASASAPVPVTVSRSSGKGAGAHTRRTSGHGARAARARKRTTTVIEPRELAHASVTSETDGVLELRLEPASRYRSLLSGRDGLFATITVTFAAPGHPKLTQTLQASFPRLPASGKAAKRSARRGKPGSSAAGHT